MKNLIVLLTLFSLAIVSSCGDDDSADPVAGLSGTVTFNGNTYTIANGLFSLSDDEGNAVGEFYLADGTITENSNGGVSSTDSEILIAVSATATGSTTLTNGDYATSTNVPDLYCFVTVSTSSGSSQSFTGGSVSISGSGNTYTLTFTDIPFGQGVTLSGTVAGTYEN